MLKRANTNALFLILALAALPTLATAFDVPMPRGAQEAFVDTSPLDSYALPVGPYAAGGPPHVALEGVTTRRAFHIANDSITLTQMMQPMRKALVDAGFTLELECNQVSCGGFDFRFATEVLPAPAMYVDLTNFRFLAARRAAEGVSIFASATPARRFVQVIHVTPTQAQDSAEAAPQSGDVQTAAPLLPTPPETGSAIAEALAQSGSVILSDLNFETARTALSAGPYASLEALAQYLTARPDVRIALVGHTDIEGSLTGNIAISEARAAAVRERLIETYNVPAEQTSAHGIGFLSPQSSNVNAAGRAQNRRVEAVLVSGG